MVSSAICLILLASAPAASAPASVRILDQTRIFQHTATDPKAPGNTGGFNHAPSVVLLPDGRLLTAWYTGPYEGAPAQKIVGSFSSDEGRTWTQAATIQDCPGRPDFDPSFVTSGKRTVMFFSVLKPTQLFYRTSDDSARTWSDPQEIADQTGHTSRTNGIRLSTGELLVPLHRTGTRAGGVLKSQDDGRTWKRFGLVANPDGQGGEPTIAQLGNGSILMFLRTRDGLVWQARSSDKGETWSTPEKSGLTGTASSHNLFRTRAGVLVLTHNPVPPGRSPLTMRVSRGEGATWGEPTAIAERPDNTPGWQVSYPSVAELADGTLVVVWTKIRAARGENWGDIHAARVAIDGR